MSLTLGEGEYRASDEVAGAFRKSIGAQLKAIQAEFSAEQEAGEAALRTNLRAWTTSHLQEADIQATLELARKIRAQFEVFILVGIGGSDLGGRVLHDALDNPFHNQLSKEERGGGLELYFTGDTFDPKRLVALLNLLKKRDLLTKTCVNVVSKSGKTGETISAAMILKEELQKAGVEDWAQHIVATTGYEESSVLWQMNEKNRFFGMAPVPQGVGGRFSYISPVGLLPYAVTAFGDPEARMRTALEGQAEAHRRFLLPADAPENLAYRLAEWLHYAENYGRKTSLVFCNYADDSRITEWMGQLYTESIQERGAGLNIIGTRGPAGNHSLLNGILRGPREKAVLFLHWEDLGEDLTIPSGSGIKGDLAAFEGLKMTQVQTASWLGTFEDYAANGLACAALKIAKRDGAHLFMLMRVLMDAVAIKGRLQLLHIDDDGKPNPPKDLTYQQDGVEGYKNRTRDNALKMRG